jgi:LysM repeat protein
MVNKEMIMRAIFLVLGVLVVGSGCETLTGQQQRVAETRLYNEMTTQKVAIQRLEQRLEGLEAEREALYGQMAALQQALSESNSRRQAELETVHAQLTAQAQAQATLRRELADELSGRMAKILQTQATSASTGARKQAGYAHTVKAGQTLSVIAREYKTTTDAIVKANNLKSANDIKVGQELFIPE